MKDVCNFSEDSLEVLNDYFEEVTMKRPSPETDVLRVKYLTGLFINKKETGAMLNLAATTSTHSEISFLKTDTCEIAVHYYWENYWRLVILLT